MDLQAVRVVFFVAVSAGGFVGLGVAPELPLHDGVRCQDHICILELLWRGGPLVAMIHNHLRPPRHPWDSDLDIKCQTCHNYV